MDKELRQAYSTRIRQLLTCPPGQEAPIFEAHPELLSLEFLDFVTQVTDGKREKGDRKTAESLERLLALLQEALQGFLSPFARYLVRANYLSADRALRAEIHSRRTGIPLPDALRDASDRPFEASWWRQYHKQQRFEYKLVYGLEVFDPDVKPVSPFEVAELMREYIGFETCRDRQLLPLSVSQNQLPALARADLRVAMVNPAAAEIQNKLRLDLWADKVVLQTVAIIPSDYRHILEQCAETLGESLEELAVEPAVKLTAAIAPEATKEPSDAVEIQTAVELYGNSASTPEVKAPEAIAPEPLHLTVESEPTAPPDTEEIDADAPLTTRSTPAPPPSRQVPPPPPPVFRPNKRTTPAEPPPELRVPLWDSPFSRRLIARGYLTEVDMERAFRVSRASDRPLPEVLRNLGKPLSTEWLSAYQQQQLWERKVFFGMEAYDPGDRPIPPEETDKLVGEYIPLDLCYHYQLLPLYVEQHPKPALVVAMVNPFHQEALDELTLLLRLHELSLRRLVLTQALHRELLDRYQRYLEDRFEQLFTPPADLEDGKQEILAETDVFYNIPPYRDAERAEILGREAQEMQPGVSDATDSEPESSPEIALNRGNMTDRLLAEAAGFRGNVAEVDAESDRDSYPPSPVAPTRTSQRNANPDPSRPLNPYQALWRTLDEWFRKLGWRRRVSLPPMPAGEEAITEGATQLLQPEEPSVLDDLTLLQVPDEQIAEVFIPMESFDPQKHPVSAESIVELMESYLPIEVCRYYELLPLGFQHVPFLQLTIAMVHPHHHETQTELQTILQLQNLSWERVSITPLHYQRLMAQCMEVLVQQKDLELPAASGKGAVLSLDADAETLGKSEAATTQLVNDILTAALTNRASEVHIEPQAEHLSIRIRQDGILQEMTNALPAHAARAIIARCQTLASIDPSRSPYQPQQGRMQRRWQGQPYEFLVDAVPGRYGECLVLKVIDGTIPHRRLVNLVSDTDTLQAIRNLLARPFGLILITGLADTGKTTTAAACLLERCQGGVNIFTVEDPIEYSLPGINQVEVNPYGEMDFPTALQSVMRQKPEAIFISDIPDLTTARMLVEAAFSRLVIATFAVPDAASALVRLRAMGIEASLLASVLVGTINQRLLRQICSHCRVPEILTGGDRFGLSAEGRTAELYKARVVPLDMRQAMAREERLCSHCGGAGYRGRLGVYEVMEIDKTLAAFIGRDMPSDQLHAAAVRTGMKTLLSSSLELVKQGRTTLQEIERSILPPVQR